VLGFERGISDDYYNYYWFTNPGKHPYDVTTLPFYKDEYLNKIFEISSLDHLKWGLYRIYVDGLLFFGNVRYSYKQLSSCNMDNIIKFFSQYRIDTKSIKDRGPALQLEQISRDNRYLISEMACKTYGDDPLNDSYMKHILTEAWNDHKQRGGGSIYIKDLLNGEYIKSKYIVQQTMLIFSADDILDQQISTYDELKEKYEIISKIYQGARKAALKNTEYYLSVVNDLDIYVATSMRTRDDFRKMAKDCDDIFLDDKLKDLHLRYFDPTMSAAEGHQDKGLIECLMVKCAKVLVYCAGKLESYGKDAEAAMAMSFGKTVIFYCDQEQRKTFYRDVHPLSRLINFQTGVAIGAIVTDKIMDVSELLYRIFYNKLEYILEQPKPGYLQLKEKITDSVVRIQTNNKLLTRAFWNYYITH
jgi:hypothetical protein